MAGLVTTTDKGEVIDPEVRKFLEDFLSESQNLFTIDNDLQKRVANAIARHENEEGEFEELEEIGLVNPEGEIESIFLQIKGLLGKLDNQEAITLLRRLNVLHSKFFGITTNDVDRLLGNIEKAYVDFQEHPEKFRKYYDKLLGSCGHFTEEFKKIPDGKVKEYALKKLIGPGQSISMSYAEMILETLRFPFRVINELCKTGRAESK